MSGLDFELDPDVVAEMREIASRPETAAAVAAIVDADYWQNGATDSRRTAPPCRPRRRRVIAGD